MKFILRQLLNVIYHASMIIFAWSPKIKKGIFLAYFNIKQILR